MPSDCILIYSGGLDSTVLLYALLNGGQHPRCLTFNYGQRHRREINCAREFCETLAVPFNMVDLTSITRLIATGSLAGHDPVPEGRYDEESMKATIVPNRNMIMLSIAVGTAVAAGINDVYYAAHAGDHAIYPDCRPEFVMVLNRAARVGNDAPMLSIHVPFVENTKVDIVRRGLELGVPFELTHSCYTGFTTACGRCGACVERLEAFWKVSHERLQKDLDAIEDPLVYADREYWRTVCQK